MAQLLNWVVDIVVGPLNAPLWTKKQPVRAATWYGATAAAIRRNRELAGTGVTIWAVRWRCRETGETGGSG